MIIELLIETHLFFKASTSEATQKALKNIFKILAKLNTFEINLIEVEPQVITNNAYSAVMDLMLDFNVENYLRVFKIFQKYKTLQPLEVQCQIEELFMTGQN